MYLNSDDSVQNGVAPSFFPQRPSSRGSFNQRDLPPPAHQQMSEHFQQQRQQQDVYHLENTTSKLNIQYQQLQFQQQQQQQQQHMLIGQQPQMNPMFVGSNVSNSAPTTISDRSGASTDRTISETAAGGGDSGTVKSKETRVKVVLRVRPPISEDTANSYSREFEDCTTVHPEGGNITIRRNNYEEREYSFDHVLDQMVSQEEMYKTVAKSIVDDVLQGYNGTILAYGQTGTGKTFTVFGPGTHWEYDTRRFKANSNIVHVGPDGQFCLHKMSGIIPRSIHQIFEHVELNKHTSEFRVTVSFLQIYMENIMDLLDSSKVNLNVREDPKLGIFVENLTTVVVQEPQDIIQLIKEGAQNRAVSSTNMNKVSSRSHVILNITLEQRPYGKDENKYSDNGSTRDPADIQSAERQNNDSARGGESSRSSRSIAANSDKDPHHSVRRGTLTIVDLAGSERVSKSGSEGQRLEEAKKINKSLSALGNCVAALTSERATHVPFRDSKLTRLLTDSLGGNSKTCLVATIGPAVWNYDESYSTLLFATRAMAVTNHAVINEVVDFKALSGNLQRKISLIEDEKYRLLARNVDLENEVAVLRNELLAVQNTRPTTAFNDDGVSNRNLDDTNGLAQEERLRLTQQWEERERELVNKFSSIIQHLQKEVSRLNALLQSRNSLDGSSAILNQITDSLLAIPAVRKNITERLLTEDERAEKASQ